MSIFWNKEKKWKLLIIIINYCSESIFVCILFILFSLSLFSLFYFIVEWCENENENNKFKILLNFVFSLLLFMNFFTIWNSTKIPILSIVYINDNVNQETIKNKKEIVNDIINLDIPLNYNLDSKRYTYEFEISQEDANQIANKKEEFDKKKKEIKDNGNIKFVD